MLSKTVLIVDDEALIREMIAVARSGLKSRFTYRCLNAGRRTFSAAVP